jgi:hypothetical protein
MQGIGGGLSFLSGVWAGISAGQEGKAAGDRVGAAMGTVDPTKPVRESGGTFTNYYASQNGDRGRESTSYTLVEQTDMNDNLGNTTTTRIIALYQEAGTDKLPEPSVHRETFTTDKKGIVSVVHTTQLSPKEKASFNKKGTVQEFKNQNSDPHTWNKIRQASQVQQAADYVQFYNTVGDGLGSASLVFGGISAWTGGPTNPVGQATLVASSVTGVGGIGAKWWASVNAHPSLYEGNTNIKYPFSN